MYNCLTKLYLDCSYMVYHGAEPRIVMNKAWNILQTALLKFINENERKVINIQKDSCFDHWTEGEHYVMANITYESPDKNDLNLRTINLRQKIEDRQIKAAERLQRMRSKNKLHFWQRLFS